MNKDETALVYLQRKIGGEMGTFQGFPALVDKGNAALPSTFRMHNVPSVLAFLPTEQWLKKENARSKQNFAVFHDMISETRFSVGSSLVGQGDP
jgi:hypothetical protein